jgi:hypothetical protein
MQATASDRSPKGEVILSLDPPRFLIVARDAEAEHQLVPAARAALAAALAACEGVTR